MQDAEWQNNDIDYITIPAMTIIQTWFCLCCNCSYCHVVDILSKLCNCIINWKFTFLIYLCVGTFVATSGAYMTVFLEVLYNAGYSHYQDVVGYLGTAITITSVICLIVTSRWIDYSKRY